MSKSSKVTFFLCFVIVSLLCVSNVFAFTLNDVKLKTSRLQRKARKITEDIRKSSGNAFYNDTRNFGINEAMFRASDFEEEVYVYDNFLSDYNKASNIDLLQAYTERLNSYFVKLDKSMRKLNYYPRSFEKSGNILREINQMIFSSNQFGVSNNIGQNVYTNPNPVFIGNTASVSPQIPVAQPVVEQQPAQQQPKQSQTISLGRRTATGDKRFQWMVGSSVKSITIKCLEGDAVVDTLFIDGEIRKAIARKIQAGDVIVHASNGSNIKRIVMPVRKVGGILKVECIVEK